MNGRKLFRRWKDLQARRLADLVVHERNCRLRGAAEDLHELRVVARRIRLQTRLGAAWYGAALSHAFRDWARAMAALTGPVRDLDVALEWLHTQQGSGPAQVELAARRAALWRRRAVRLTAPRPEVLAALRHPRGGSGREGRLERRCQRLAKRLHKRLATEAAHFHALPLPAQHEFRRLARRWRYLRELQIPSRKQGQDVLLRSLTELQGALGDRQNILLAQAAIRRLKRSAADAPRLLELAQKAQRKTEADLRRRLKAFLQTA